MRMTPERWRRMDSVFQCALDLPPGERAAYLRDACQGDARLREEVQALLDSHDQAGAFIDGPALPTAEAFALETAVQAAAKGPRSLAAGRRLGPYRIEALLGAGGMGEVYRALDTRLGREVALKVLPAAFHADAARRARFEREARAVAALNHPNIVTLHSLEEAGGFHFITMELVEGQTLDRLISPGGLAADVLAGYALALSEAVATAHRRGIVHRDLKPGNVMLTGDGRLKLLDFGVATIAAGSGAFAALDRAGQITREGMLIGTCRYMSPEQLQGRVVDCRSDVFSLGVVLYELAAGRSPFGGLTEAEACAAILHGQPAPLRTLRPDLPAELCDCILRCLDKDPGRRFSDAAEVHAALVSPRRHAAAASSLESPPPSVAVLPFLNLSTSAENEVFADGITEDVIAHLSKIRALKVISRTSVMSLKQRDRSLREIGCMLGVGAILEGSVRRAGNRVRIVAQLLDAATDDHLWAETYDRDLTDIFAIQTEVALQIAAALRAELSPGEQKRIRRAPTQNLDAYHLYLQGRSSFRKYTEDGFRQGIRHFERAIAEDPDFALAYVGLACVLAECPNEGFLSLRPEVAQGRAKEAVERALALDDGLGDAHGIRALLKFVCDYDWVGAEEEFKRALELSPGSADVYDHYGWMCSALLRFDDAIRLARKARELDPLAHRSDLANELLRAGRVQEALELGARIVELEPDFSRGHSVFGWACMLAGRQAEGVAALERAVALSQGGTLFLGQLGQAYAMTGYVARARDVLRKLQDMSARGYVSPYHFAYVHTGLGEQEEAMDWLERAFEQRSGAIYGIKGSFLFKSLRSHPRFDALLKKMNLS